MAQRILPEQDGANELCSKAEGYKVILGKANFSSSKSGSDFNHGLSECITRWLRHIVVRRRGSFTGAVMSEVEQLIH